MIIKKLLFFVILTTISISYAGKPVNLILEEDINNKINLFIYSFSSLNQEIDKYSKKNSHKIEILDCFEERISKLFEILDDLKNHSDSFHVKKFGIERQGDQLAALNNKLNNLYSFVANIGYLQLLENPYENSEDDNNASAYQNEEVESLLFSEESQEEE